MSTFYTKPAIKGYTVYTKKNCPYCVNVKKVLQNEKVLVIECDDYILDDKDTFLNFMDTITHVSHRTFPMVFHNNRFIGGFNDTKTYLQTYNY